jgi:hypothetical protein
MEIDCHLLAQCVGHRPEHLCLQRPHFPVYDFQSPTGGSQGILGATGEIRAITDNHGASEDVLQGLPKRSGVNGSNIILLQANPDW